MTSSDLKGVDASLFTESMKGRDVSGLDDDNSKNVARLESTLSEVSDISEPLSTPFNNLRDSIKVRDSNSTKGAHSSSSMRPVLPTSESSKGASTRSNDSKVSFGSVRIHKHRMSLGDNPGVSGGVPVTLAWEKEESVNYETIDAAEENLTHELRRISKNRREAIAAEHHSRNSVTLAVKEVQSIQESRFDSENDTDRFIKNKTKKRPFFLRWLKRK